MLLTEYLYPVHSIQWGESTKYIGGALFIHKQDIINQLEAIGVLHDLEITNIEIVSPGTKTRIVNIFDIFPARYRMDEGAVNYPGVLGPMQTVGNGNTAVLENFAVITTSSRFNKYHKLLDMDGIGSKLSPQSKLFQVVICATPKDERLPTAKYNYCLKKIGLSIGCFLAKIASQTTAPSEKSYTLGQAKNILPKAVYVCMLASHQISEAGEPILYGDDTAGLMPTILHPNEILDGAVITPYWSLSIDTYSLINQPVIKSLYERHQKELELAGVVVCVSHITRDKRERSAHMATQLAAEALGADIAIVTKVGGGIPESDLMMTVEMLEEKGVKTVAIVWSYVGDGSVRDSLSTFSEKADALVSAGMQDEWVTLPQQDYVIGGDKIGPFTDDPKERPVPSHEEIRVRYRDLSGAISQYGASYVAQEEI